jgi:octaprenyl-diphosphate synthase
MREFGELIGTAFQIRDDILDYDTLTDTGKPACNDLAEQKITLPLLVVLERSTPERRAELLARLSAIGSDSHSGSPAASSASVPSSASSFAAVPSSASVPASAAENIAYLHDVVLREGGIAEAEKVMAAYIARAQSLLAPYPLSPYHNSLALLASYAADRKK